MLRLALVFLGIAIAAAIVGFGGVAGFVGDSAKFLFLIFLILFLIAMILVFTRREPQ